MIQAVEKAAEVVGGVQALADAIGVARQSLYAWRVIPAHYVEKIEDAQRRAIAQKANMKIVDRHDMRPDIYGKRD